MTLLDVDGLRLHVTSSLEDEALQLLLDAEEQAINAWAGAVGDDYGVTEVHDGGFTYLFLRGPAGAIDSIVETVGTTETTLEEDDYRIRGDGVSVLRLATGTNPRTYWGGPVTVAYTPRDVLADRKRVQLALVQFDLNFVPGNITSEQIGAWAESHSTANPDYREGRIAILNSLSYISAPGFA